MQQLRELGLFLARGLAIVLLSISLLWAGAGIWMTAQSQGLVGFLGALFVLLFPLWFALVSLPLWRRPRRSWVWVAWVAVAALPLIYLVPGSPIKVTRTPDYNRAVTFGTP